METCIYGEPVQIPSELIQGREAWVDYPETTQIAELPGSVRVLVRLGSLFDTISVLSGPFESWSSVNQQAAEIANAWYDRGDG